MNLTKEETERVEAEVSELVEVLWKAVPNRMFYAGSVVMAFSELIAEVAYPNGIPRDQVLNIVGRCYDAIAELYAAEEKH